MRHFTQALSLLITIIACQSFQTFAVAVTWQDDFIHDPKDSWQLQGSDSVWGIEQGFLRAKIETQKQWRTLFELYQFIAFPGPYNNITIQLENIGASNELRFGIALGKHFHNDNGEIEETGYYLFLTNDMQASRNGKVFLEPGKRWQTDVLNNMVLHFDNGRFQLIGDGESRLDFIDANLTNIDIIGLVLTTYAADREIKGDAWIEKITISGLAVSPKNKITTIWGNLKQE